MSQLTTAVKESRRELTVEHEMADARLKEMEIRVRQMETKLSEMETRLSATETAKLQATTALATEITAKSLIQVHATMHRSTMHRSRSCYLRNCAVCSFVGSIDGTRSFDAAVQLHVRCANGGTQ